MLFEPLKCIAIFRWTSNLSLLAHTEFKFIALCKANMALFRNY